MLVICARIFLVAVPHLWKWRTYVRHDWLDRLCLNHRGNAEAWMGAALCGSDPGLDRDRDQSGIAPTRKPVLRSRRRMSRAHSSRQRDDLRVVFFYAPILKKHTSPSCITYSFPSTRIVPFARVPGHPPAETNASKLATSARIKAFSKSV